MKQGVWRKSDEDFYLNDYRNIVKTPDGYELQKVYELVGNEILETEENKNNPNNNERTKKCQICVHHVGQEKPYCLVRDMLENLPKHYHMYCHFQNKCDAYEPINALSIIHSKEEMINFICKTNNFFNCQEDYEWFYGFEPDRDEETDDILETTMEYFNRGGEFKNIPDKYPCVIYFPYADLSNGFYDRTDFQWIYIGDETKIS